MKITAVYVVLRRNQDIGNKLEEETLYQQHLK
jgi:hypothetical protein